MEIQTLGVQLTLEDVETRVPSWVLERLEIYLMAEREYRASLRGADD
jgi:hypothetical protein